MSVAGVCSTEQLRGDAAAVAVAAAAAAAAAVGMSSMGAAAKT
jgi:hypothetical protein